MKTLITCLIVFVTFSLLVSAEYEGEFGILYGISHVMGAGGSRQYINAPETLYLMGFASDQLGVDPEIEFIGSSPDYDSEVAFAVGAGMGYQWRVGSDFVFRAEGWYRARLGNTT